MRRHLQCVNLDLRECYFCLLYTSLREEVLNVHVAGKNIAEVERMSFDNLLIWLGEVEKNLDKLCSKERLEQLIFDIKRRVKNLINLKLEDVYKRQD